MVLHPFTQLRVHMIISEHENIYYKYTIYQVALCNKFRITVVAETCTFNMVCSFRKCDINYYTRCFVKVSYWTWYFLSEQLPDIKLLSLNTLSLLSIHVFIDDEFDMFLLHANISMQCFRNILFKEKIHNNFAENDCYLSQSLKYINHIFKC